MLGIQVLLSNMTVTLFWQSKYYDKIRCKHISKNNIRMQALILEKRLGEPLKNWRQSDMLLGLNSDAEKNRKNTKLLCVKISLHQFFSSPSSDAVWMLQHGTNLSFVKRSSMQTDISERLYSSFSYLRKNTMPRNSSLLTIK